MWEIISYNELKVHFIEDETDLGEISGLDTQVKSLETILEFLDFTCFCWFRTYVLQVFLVALVQV